MSTVNKTQNFHAGDYHMPFVFLIGQNLPMKNIRNNIIEMNIYESIDSSFMSGKIVLRDSYNERQNMGLTGQEEIEFVLRTNDEADAIDFQTVRGRIYKINNQVGITDNQQIYTLHFVSIEAMRNAQNKVLTAYSGSGDQIFTQVLKNVIKTEKRLQVQKSTNFQKVVGNTMYPFAFIDMVARRSSADKSHGFMFYENHRGYQFHSFDNLHTRTNGEKREPVESFFSTQSLEERDTDTNMRTLKDFAILRTQDTLRDYSDGLLASTNFAYNRLDKTATTTKHNYAKAHSKTPHIDGLYPLYTTTPEEPYKTLFSYDLAKTSVTTSDPSLHTQSATDEVLYDNYSSNLTLRNMRGLSLESMRVKITVNGNSNLAAGDLIHIELPNYEPIVNKTDDRVYDLYLSGNYIIAQINHKVSPEGYVSICECVKDSVNIPYESSPYTIKENLESNEI